MTERDLFISHTLHERLGEGDWTIEDFSAVGGELSDRCPFSVD